MLNTRAFIWPATWASILAATATLALADGKHHGHQDHDPHAGHDHSGYVTGVPHKATTAWKLSAGGRLYDKWWEALGTKAPTTTHPAWPATNTKKTGAVTWRCKSCHGWDYRGADGKYASGSYATGIKGVRGVIGAKLEDIAKVLSDDRHAFTDALIPAEAKQRLALFLSEGQHDTSNFITDDGKAKGDAKRGAEIFQNICAACHGFDGKAIDWGEEDEPAYVGTEANANPWEVLHKIRNGHTGHNMVSLRAFALDDAANVLAHAQTLPQQ